MLAIERPHDSMEGMERSKLPQVTHEEVTEQSLTNSSIKDRLRDLWARILRDDPSTYSDEDVFFDVGGDSILAQHLITAAQEQGILLTIEQIFMHASLEEMAEVARIVDIPEEDLKEDGSDSRAFGSINEDKTLHDQFETIASKCKVSVEHIEDAYPCSPMQASLVADFDEINNAYVRQFVFKITNSAQLEHFQHAWQETISANPVLRTRICHLEGTVGFVQAVMKERATWNTIDFDLATFLEQDASTPMSLGDQLFRYNIVNDYDHDGKKRQHFVWTAHHAVCDGASIPEIVDDVSKQSRNEPIQQRQPFKSFIESSAVRPDPWQEEQFWKKSFSGINPTPYPLPHQAVNFSADPSSTLEETLRLENLPSLGITKALLLRAAWAILLSHYNGTGDVGFGAINSGRTAAVAGVSQMTGPTINLVPIALQVDPRQSVSSFLSQVRRQAAEMTTFEHSGVSRIRKHVAGADSTAADFQTLFVVDPVKFSDAIAPALEALGLEYVDALGKKEQHPYPLVVTFTLSAERAISFRLQHDNRVISTQQAQNLIHQFQTVLTQLSLATKDTLLGSISPFSDNDLAQVRQWNASTPQAEQTCIHHLFQIQALKQPSAVAVCSLEESLTYAQVDKHSSSLASSLIGSGVRPGAFVGVCFEKSVWTVVAILAVFKAGAVYVPIDPGHPPGRIAEVVRTVQVEVAIASTVGAEMLKGLGIQILTVHDRLTSSSCSNPPSNYVPCSTAYLLFTSGSTGKPKGILMSHSAICTSIIHHGAAFGAGPHWRALQFGAHTFDLSIAEFFTTLSFGGCICVPSEHDRLNNLAGAITSLDVNTLCVVPTVANLLFPKDTPTLKNIILAGEPITKETVTRWADHVNLTDAYGPSETAVYCSGNVRVSADAHPAHIGRSIGAAMWIVNPDNYHQLSAVGCVGEIIISGGLLGGGYFDDPATTDAAFVPAPDWLKTIDPSSTYSMMYRSGDLARYNTDGTFHIVGRRDTQVKLRGFRIELGEIENQIMAHGTVTAALATLPSEGPCARQIVVAVSFNQPNLENHHSCCDITVSAERNAPKERKRLDALKQHLSLILPDYTMPSVWIILEKLPLLISGKIDRKAIKLWIDGMTYESYAGLTEDPDTEEPTEITIGSTADQIRHLWSEVLNVPAEHIGTKTAFFAIGGDSIAAIQVVSRAKDIRLPVTVRGIISTKTLGHLVTLVEQGQMTVPQNLEQFQKPQWTADILQPYENTLDARLMGRSSVSAEDAYPLSPIQREIMRQRRINPAVFLLSWQMEVTSRLSLSISLDKLAQAWQRVVKTYPILRSIFLRDPTGHLPAVQIVLANAEPTIVCSFASSEDREPSFDATKTQPVDECFLPHRAHFIQHGDRFFVHIELDHLVIDGWSLKLIKTAFLDACEAEDSHVPDIPPSYKDFVAAHRSDRVDADNKYWASVLRDQRPALLSLPVTSHVAQYSPSPSKTIMYLPVFEADALTAFGVQNGITPASIFDAAWAQTLSLYTCSPDVSFEYVVSGREEDITGIFDMVGPLINVLAYHLQDVSTGSSPLELARLAQSMQEQRAENSLHTSSNVREVIENDLQVDKLFNTAVNFQRRPTAVETAALRIDDDLKKSRDPWHFDVLVRVMHITDDGTLRPSVEFDDQRFDHAQMKEVAEDFWRRVQNIIM